MRAAAAAAMLSLPAAGCLRPGLREERPEREETTWRPLLAEERKPLLRRLAEEKILVRDEDVAAVRVPDTKPEWREWSRPWTFRGATVHLQFRFVSFRPPAGDLGWPLSFTFARDPVVEGEGLVWTEGDGAALSAVGSVLYRFDLLIPEVLDTRHCVFYERQLDRRERRHLLYKEELIQKLQNDEEDFVSRLLKASTTPHAAGSAASVAERRAALLSREAARFTEDLPKLRDRYWTAAQEEERTDRETVPIAQSDREDLIENCLPKSSSPGGS